MNAIRIRRKLDSDTLHIPELKPMLGRTVEIIVLEEETAERPDLKALVRPGTGDWETVIQSLDLLEGYDFDAWREQREYDRLHAHDHIL